MDPIHLSPEELDYELDIRGVYNLSNSRQKTTCLREFLKREERGETTITRSRSDSSNPTLELTRCGEILESIITSMQEKDFCAKSRHDCLSRLIHVINRIKRAKPLTPEEQTIVYEMLRAANEHLVVFEKSPLDNPFRDGNANLSSPLAEAIETIRATQNPSSASKTQRSLSDLNPGARDFEPDVRGAGSTRVSQQSFRTSINNIRQTGPKFVNASYSSLSGAVGGLAPHKERHAVEFELESRRTVSGSSESEAGYECEISNNRHRQYGRRYRKTVPVYQWKLTFSGDGQGLHLYDFLSELRMFQRAEGVSDGELFSSVVHLLSGRARLWYRSCFDTFANWGEMVSAMKAEFLPPKYDYKLLTTISNRRQKTSETFAEYFTTMQSMFKHLSIPVDDQHKLCIIEENMLSKYALATSVIEVVSLEQLAKICRRVDFAYTKTQFSAPVDSVANNKNITTGYQSRFRNVHEIGATHQGNVASSSDRDRINSQVSQYEPTAPPEMEVLEMRNGQNRGGRNESAFESRECFNCSQVGHSFSACPEPKKGQFCFRCGSRDVTSFTCKYCAKNGGTNPVGRDGPPNSRA